MASRGHHRDVITTIFVVLGVVGSLGSLVLVSSSISLLGLVGFVAGFLAVTLGFALLPDQDLNELGFASVFAIAFLFWAAYDIVPSIALEALVAIMLTVAGGLCAVFTTRRWTGMQRTRRLLGAGAAGVGWAVLLVALGHGAFPGVLGVFPAGLGVVIGGFVTTALVRELDIVHSAVGQMPWLVLALGASHSVWFAETAPPRPASAMEIAMGGICGGVLLAFIGGGVGAMFGNAARRKPVETKPELPEARQID